MHIKLGGKGLELSNTFTLKQLAEEPESCGVPYVTEGCELGPAQLLSRCAQTVMTVTSYQKLVAEIFLKERSVDEIPTAP